MNSIYKFFMKERSFLFLWCCSSFLAMLFIFPILFSGVYYEDDLFRIFTGQYVWEMLGRVATYYLMKIVTFSNDNMLNVTPLPLLLSTILLSYLMAYVVFKILKKNNLVSLLVSFCFICNPYIISNLSYSYDNFHMVLGYFLSIFSFVFIANKKYYGILLLIISFLLYQPMGNVFLSLSFFWVVYKLCLGEFNKDSIKQFLFFVVCYCLALLAYMIFIKIFYLIFQYPLQRSEQLSIKELLGGTIILRIKLLYEYVSILWSNVEAKICLVLLFSGVSIFALKNRSVIFVFVLFIVLFSLFLSLLGPMFLLKEGLVTARVMTPLGVIILLLLYLNLKLTDESNKYIKFFGFLNILIFSWYLVTLSFGYGNYMSLQRKYDENLLNMIQYDVLTLGQKEYKRWIHLEGCPQKPKSILFMDSLRPYYKQLYQPACSWRSKFIIFDSVLGNFKFDRSWSSSYPEIRKKICENSLTPAIDRDLYNIYDDGKTFIFIDIGKKFKC